MTYLDPSAGTRRGDYAEVQIASLTHAVGTADGTIDDVGGAFNQTTLNNNLKELSTKINAILVELRKAGIIST